MSRGATVLVALMMLVVAWSIETADYAPGLSILTPLVLCAVGVGYALGRMEWLPGTLAHGWSMVLGVAVTAVLATSVQGHHDPDALQGLGMADRLAHARDWYLAWISAARAGARMEEALVQFAFVVTMALLMWLLAYICTWFVVRYRSWWGATLPSGFALLFNLHQVRDADGVPVAVFLFCALLLAEQTHVTAQLDRWRADGVAFGTDVAFDYLRDGLLIAIVVVGAAWFAPATVVGHPWQRALRGWNASSDPVRERLARILPPPPMPSVRAGAAFGPSLPLGGSVTLGGQAIFEAQIDGAESAPRYWRMAVFDQYDGSGWHRTPGEITPADIVAADRAPWAATVPVSQTIRVFQDGTTQLVAASQPDRFDILVRLELDVLSEPPDLLTATSPQPLSVGATYGCVSRISTASASALAEAGPTDPPWSARYLVLPDSVPARVRQLATHLTGAAGGRFQAATAIEDHLRSYQYSEVIADPPAGRDLVDWFLFDERRGYCDYFSSAFVVLARAAGIPARIAAGYSTGEFVEGTGTFRQYESDAHTWPEVFFPEYGWIEFEPTSGDARIDRPVASAPPPLVEPDTTEVPTPEAALSDATARASVAAAGSKPQSRDGLGITAVLTSLLAATVALAAAWAVWRRPFAGLTVAQGAYARLVRAAAWLRIRSLPADTPREFGGRVVDALPEAGPEVDQIVEAFVGETYGRRSSEARAAELSAAWARLRTVLVRASSRLLGR